MNNAHKYGSDEYSPTPSHALPAFSRNGKGFICPSCGHLELTLDDNIYEDICPKCVIKALRKLKIPVMITIKEFHKSVEALEETKKAEKPRHEMTTEIHTNKKMG
jgi:hypothetical protein